MPRRVPSIRALAAIVLISLCLAGLYFYGLARVGMLSTDEPRYAAIGREMAESGDWITPRLFGSPWFEKPALLYWMTALGFDAGLGEDLAPRLPVAIVSVGFLIFYFFTLRRRIGPRPAAFAACILATSAGWLAYSHISVTDLPLSAAFAAAMLLAESGSFIPAGVCLGLAVLAKGLVPLALFLPAVWFLRRRPRALATILGVAALVALPWYVLVTVRNGSAFVDEFFWKHHFERFATGALMHDRPFWFYIPVLLAGLFPWTPTVVLLFRRELYKRPLVPYLVAWFGFGFVFFSAAENKLPGYLLPLLPAVAALCGIALAEAGDAKFVMAASAVLLLILPAVERVIPQALISGLSHTHLEFPLTIVIPIAAVSILCWWLDRSGQRMAAVAVLSICVTLAIVQFVWTTYPLLDHMVSARQFYRSQGGTLNCVSSPNRAWRYGLDYYAHRTIPDCK